jgi:hypothetical protein
MKPKFATVTTTNFYGFNRNWEADGRTAITLQFPFLVDAGD